MEGCGATLLTGGTKGIGLATAQEMVNMGYRQFILGYHRDDSAAQEAKVDLEQTAGVKIALIKGDISDKSTIEAHFRAVEEQFDGKLFAVIHIAGEFINLNSGDHETIFDQYQELYGKALWRLAEKGIPCMEKSPHGGDISAKSTIEAHFRVVEEQFDGKLFAIIHTAGGFIKLDSADHETIFDQYQELYGKALWRLVEKGIPFMEKSPHGGRIITVSSPGVNIMSAPRVNYFLPGCGKSSMEYITRSYALKLAPKKITCNIVIPGITQTTGWEQIGLSPADIELLAERRCPMKTVIPPKAIGEAIAFLVSEKASFITGAILPVDGGLMFV